MGVDVSLGVEIRSENDFYEPLTPYGRWEVVGGHGRCWIPSRVSEDWRPYSNGHWERTEAGWYWASDEPWAWATYHYGRWDVSADLGWFWVPQTRWAPAWVSWHHGGGYLGWAPLQPSVRFAPERPVEVDVRLIPPRAFVFVEEKRFLEPVRPTTVVVNNTTIINKTVNITNIKVVNNTVINEGPRTQVIEQVSGRTVQAVPVHELRRREEAAVVAAKRVVPPTSGENIQVPARSRPDPLQSNPQMKLDQRARDLHQKADEESQRHARDLERTAQRQSEQRARELQRTAQEESQRGAKELQRKAQIEAQQRTLELHQRAQEESKKHAKELEQKAQLEAQQRARELERKAQEESQKAARELERKAQLQAEQRDRELHQRVQEAARRSARQPGLIPPGQIKHEQVQIPTRRPNTPKKDQKKKVDGQEIPPEKPAVPIQPPP